MKFIFVSLIALSSFTAYSQVREPITYNLSKTISIPSEISIAIKSRQNNLEDPYCISNQLQTDHYLTAVGEGYRFENLRIWFYSKNDGSEHVIRAVLTGVNKRGETGSMFNVECPLK